MEIQTPLHGRVDRTSGQDGSTIGKPVLPQMGTTRQQSSVQQQPKGNHLPGVSAETHREARTRNRNDALEIAIFGAIAVIALAFGLLAGVWYTKSTAPLCQDQFGLKLNQRVYCVQIGDGPLE